MKVIRHKITEKSAQKDEPKEHANRCSPELLQKILNDLNAVQWSMQKLQHAVNKADVNGILEALVESNKIVKSSPSESDGTSAVLLGDYMKVRHDNGVRQAERASSFAS